LCNTALLSSGAINTIGRVTLFSALQSVGFVTLGAAHSLEGLGFAMIASGAVGAVIWLRAVSKQIGLPMRGMVSMLGKSAAVALTSAIGPAFALWCYGLYPETVAAPLVIGVVGGLVGFVVGTLVSRHPLEQEFTAVWLKIRH
jgi:hypothetical protein